MFELLFNYPLRLWQESTLTWASGWSVGLLLAVWLAALALVLLSLWRQPLSLPRRGVLTALQGLVIGAALLMLWQPTLVSEVTRPGDNSVAWLLDGSASMNLPDESGGTRREALQSILDDDRLFDDDTFQHRFHQLGEGLTRLPGRTLAEGVAPATAIGVSIDEQLARVDETSLAGIVLLSDGADNVGGIDADWWRRVSRSGVPIHTVGLGRPDMGADIELVDVALPAAAMESTSVTARLHLRHGEVEAGGETLRLRITAGSELVHAEDLTLDPGSRESVREVQFPAGETGMRELVFRVSRADGGTPESNRINNRQRRMLEVRDTPRRILYVEGEPRWEYKFIRRALDADAAVDIVSLLRTSPNKFYRQGVSSASELAAGFPRTREALFVYDAVIIGSLEAAELDANMQAALRDFVAVRGGALLMLAGRRGLADGGWARSAIGDALPVTLGSRLDVSTFERRPVPVRPTQQGERIDWLQLADGAAANREAWSGLPEVGDYQSVGDPKPGARVLLETADGARGDPLLVWQRYGQGVSAVLGTSGTWRWQMSLPSSDQRHEMYWQRLLGELASGALPRVAVQSNAPVLRDTDSTRVRVQAYAADYTPLEADTLVARLTRPDDRETDVPLVSDPEHRGRFTARVSMPVDGPYRLTVTSPVEGESPVVGAARAEHWFIRESGTAEAFGAQRQDLFLERLASVSGGRFLRADQVRELPALLEASEAALKRERRLPLWNMPFLFLCLFLGKALEWQLRLRWKRL